MFFRIYLIAASLATALYGYGQFNGHPLFSATGESRDRGGPGAARLYHK
ncbi:hypothetical protein [Chitinimonas arctica]|nr:hypothetical protein [Chitinimonas arctica]